MGTLLLIQTNYPGNPKKHVANVYSNFLVLSMNTQLLKVNFEIDLRLFEQSKVQSTPRWWRLCSSKKGVNFLKIPH